MESIRIGSPLGVGCFFAIWQDTVSTLILLSNGKKKAPFGQGGLLQNGTQAVLFYSSMVAIWGLWSEDTMAGMSALRTRKS